MFPVNIRPACPERYYLNISTKQYEVLKIIFVPERIHYPHLQTSLSWEVSAWQYSMARLNVADEGMASMSVDSCECTEEAVRTADRGWYSRLGVGRGANNSSK